MPGTFGEHPGLARTGRRDDAGCTARVGDGGELVGCQCRSAGREPEWPHCSVLDGDGRHHDCTVEWTAEPQWPTVDPARAHSGHLDVGSGRWRRAQRHGALGPRPPGTLSAEHHTVGPHQVVEFVEQQLAAGTHLVQWPRIGLGGWALECRTHHDDHSLTLMVGATQPGDGRGRCSEHLMVDHHHLAGSPGEWHIDLVE